MATSGNQLGFGAAEDVIPSDLSVGGSQSGAALSDPFSNDVHAAARSSDGVTVKLVNPSARSCCFLFAPDRAELSIQFPRSTSMASLAAISPTVSVVTRLPVPNDVRDTWESALSELASGSVSKGDNPLVACVRYLSEQLVPYRNDGVPPRTPLVRPLGNALRAGRWCMHSV